MTLTCFTSNVAFANYSQPIAKIHEAAFAVMMDQLTKKIHKYAEKRDLKKVLDTCFEVKKEVEFYLGTKIKLSPLFDQIEKEMKKSGAKFSKDEFKQVKKAIEKKEKRLDHKDLYMQDCIEYGIDFDEDVELFLYEKKHGKDEEKSEMCMPIRVTIGVSVALCGLFLFFVPIPQCKTAGAWIMGFGFNLAVDGTINRMEEDEK